MQRRIDFSPPDIGQLEIDEVTAVLRSGWITTGAKTRQLEQELAAFCGTRRVVCLNSATAALELTLRVLGVGAGDEVITSPYTYSASASVILHVGAVAVFVDTAPNSFLIDYNQVEQAFTDKTKAIIGVDVAGMMCDYPRLIDIAQQKNALFLPNSALQNTIGRAAVVADAAHSLGATANGQQSGCAADFTAFSFHAVKNLTTAEGGAATWRPAISIDDQTLYRQFSLLALHGQSKDAFAKAEKGCWEYDILIPGYKHNLPDVLAAIGVAQLSRYPTLLARRKQLVAQYNSVLCDSRFILPKHQTGHSESSRHLYPVRIKGCDEGRRNHIIQSLSEKGIAANVHYKPLPMLTAYKTLGYRIADYPNAFAQYQNEITLPLHTLLTDDDVTYIAQGLMDACDEVL